MGREDWLNWANAQTNIPASMKSCVDNDLLLHAYWDISLLWRKYQCVAFVIHNSCAISFCVQ